MLYLELLGVFLVLWAIFYALRPVLQHAKRVAARVVTRLSTRYGRIGRFTTWARAFLPIAIIVVVGAVIIAWFADTFIDLAEMLHSNSPKLRDFDMFAHVWAVSKRTTSETSFFVLMTNIGGPGGMAVLATIVAITLIVTKRFRWLAYFVVTVGGGSLLNVELKRYFARARPALADMLKRAHGYSFPSGHAMGSTVVLLAIAYLAVRTATHWRWKAACLAFAWTLIIAVAVSRVYLGAHWISDVAAGISAGALWVGLTTLAYETVRRIRLLRARRISGS